ncbi:MAG: butyrate kinase [Treponema sp.]|nr:butyrate kinase [Treponema sp.]
MAALLILAINPGSTSTKIGLFGDESPIFTKTIEHDHGEVQKFPRIAAQKDFRLGFIRECLAEHGVKPGDLAGVVGIGGLLPPVEAGGYLVDRKMLDFLGGDSGGAHASNLGAILADLLAREAGCDAYIYDAVSAGILGGMERLTGFPEIERRSLSHVLNMRAQAIQYARKIGRSFPDLNLVLAHLGGGISVAAYEKGTLRDSLGDDIGPFSSERSGGVPLMDFVDFCYDGGLDRQEVRKRIRGGGGLKAHLGTASLKEAEQMIERGDEKALLVVRAMCYGIAKGIGSLAVALKGRCDGVILTGGMTRSQLVTGLITEHVGFIAPVTVMPGEYELEALAEGCIRILKGEEKARRM